MNLSIVIVTSGRNHLVKRLLASMESCLKSYENFEVILVSHKIQTDVEQELKKIGKCQYILNLSLGANKSRNIGLEKTSGKNILFLDDDVIFTDQFTQILMKKSEQDINSAYSGIYGSTSEMGYFQKVYNVICNLWLLKTHLGNRPQFLGGVFLVSRKNLESIRFEESKCGAGEEDRVSSLLRSNGVKIYLDSNMILLHDSQKSFSDFLSTAYAHGSLHANSGDKTSILHRLIKLKSSIHFDIHLSYLPGICLYLLSLLVGRMVRSLWGQYEKGCDSAHRI